MSSNQSYYTRKWTLGGLALNYARVQAAATRVKAAVAAGYLDERAAVLETLTSIRRAGADIVITYHAKGAAEWLA